KPPFSSSFPTSSFPLSRFWTGHALRNTFSRPLLERFSVAPCSFTGQAQIRPQLVLPWFVFPSSAKICLRRRMTAFAIRACFRCCLAPSLASPTSFTRWKPRNLRAGQNFFWRLRRHARFASFWSGPALARSHLGWGHAAVGPFHG